MPVATDHTSRIISVRVPEHLERQLEALAQRDANSVSATVRRLLSYAVSREAREAQ
jgi:Arc/MetJ-type ribon-helix-helix transcriptional regulator